MGSTLFVILKKITKYSQIRMKYKLKKINNNKVIFTDGLIGGGKTLIAGLVSSFKNIDPWIYNSNYEKFVHIIIGDIGQQLLLILF